MPVVEVERWCSVQMIFLEVARKLQCGSSRCKGMRDVSLGEAQFGLFPTRSNWAGEKVGEYNHVSVCVHVLCLVLLLDSTA